jgi:hypothetical protein
MDKKGAGVYARSERDRAAGEVWARVDGVLDKLWGSAHWGPFKVRGRTWAGGGGGGGGGGSDGDQGGVWL